MKNFSKSFCMVRLVLLLLALTLAMILSGCQSVQEKLEDLFGSSSSSSQGLRWERSMTGSGESPLG